MLASFDLIMIWNRLCDYEQNAFNALVDGGRPESTMVYDFFDLGAVLLLIWPMPDG